MLIFKIISGHWCSPITVPQDAGCPCGNSNCWAEQSSVRKPHTRASAHSCVYPCEYPNSSSIWTSSRIDRTHNSLSPYEPTHVFGDISVREKIYHINHICSSSRPCGLFFGGVARNEGEGTSSRICYKWVPGGRVSSPCAVISCGGAQVPCRWDKGMYWGAAWGVYACSAERSFPWCRMSGRSRGTWTFLGHRRPALSCILRSNPYLLKKNQLSVRSF